MVTFATAVWFGRGEAVSTGAGVENEGTGAWVEATEPLTAMVYSVAARPADEAEEEIMDVSGFWRLAPYILTEAVRFADVAGRTEVRKVAGTVLRNMYPGANPVL